MDNNYTPTKELVNPILKLSRYIHKCPFLIYGVIAIFGFPLSVAVIFFVLKDLIITLVIIILIFIFMIHCSNLESKIKNNEIDEAKKKFDEMVGRLDKNE